MKFNVDKFLLILIFTISYFVDCKDSDTTAPELPPSEDRNGLIFSEVYLDENNPDKSWIEIYNPTSQPLVLEKFRFLNIKTTNILPEAIQEKGGIEILPGKCLVLCASAIDFHFDFNAKSALIEVSVMAAFGKGGFFSLRTKDMGEDGVDLFRYGDPEKTVKWVNEIGDFVVPFSTNGKSFHRKMTKGIDESVSPEFYSAEPSPGQHD